LLGKSSKSGYCNNVQVQEKNGILSQAKVLNQLGKSPKIVAQQGPNLSRKNTHIATRAKFNERKKQTYT
jgi:hypothetical protein